VELAERSQHSAPHVLNLFDQADPNPTLRLYLELVYQAGARLFGVTTNEPVESSSASRRSSSGRTSPPFPRSPRSPG